MKAKLHSVILNNQTIRLYLQEMIFDIYIFIGH